MTTSTFAPTEPQENDVPNANFGLGLEQNNNKTMTTTLQTTNPNPSELMRQSTDVAGVSKQIVLKTAMSIQGRKYVRVEGWQAIATAHGCILSSGSVQKTETGFTAIGTVKRIHDGAIIAQAEGFVGEDEKTWSNRAEYAKRAMAQTRAMSRAARSAFAHIVVLMDAGLETTPAEEIPFDDNEKPVQPKPEPVKQAEAPKAAEPTNNAFDPTKDYNALLDHLVKVNKFTSPEQKVSALNNALSKLNQRKAQYDNAGKTDLFVAAHKEIFGMLESLKPEHDESDIPF